MICAFARCVSLPQVVRHCPRNHCMILSVSWRPLSVVCIVHAPLVVHKQSGHEQHGRLAATPSKRFQLQVASDHSCPDGRDRSERVAEGENLHTAIFSGLRLRRSTPPIDSELLCQGGVDKHRLGMTTPTAIARASAALRHDGCTLKSARHGCDGPAGCPWS